MRTVVALFLACLLFLLISARDPHDNVQWEYDDPRWDDKIANWWDEENFIPPSGPEAEQSRGFWMSHGQSLLDAKLNAKQNMNKAKNLVIFIADGMGISTQMAARAYKGGEEEELSFEKFPFMGLSKTYCINYLVPDSGCTATAILSGIKNNFGTINVNGRVNLWNCEAHNNSDNVVDSIIKFAQDAGKATGVVTNTRITHATPAAAYAKTPFRYWESNEDVREGCEDVDVAHQLIHSETGSRLDVVMGGGRRHFLPNTFVNENLERGWRTDNRNLIDEYLALHRAQNRNASLVQTRVRLDLRHKKFKCFSTFTFRLS